MNAKNEADALTVEVRGIPTTTRVSLPNTINREMERREQATI